MKRHDARTVLVVATLFAVLMAGFTAAPATAAAKRLDATERYALKLVNCLRTGGRVTRDGKCHGYGSGKHSRYRAPLKLSKKISDNVSWPWAKKIALANVCRHSFAGSTVDKRFRAAGLKDQKNGENIGCSSRWYPRKMVIRVIRWWQGEKSWNGWHWRQLKHRGFKVAGVGMVKLANGRTRLVVDFYGTAIS